ncbi:MAG: TolC family outer membrane protein [Alphaproteobacteria bacterium]|nr:TolC family outer membrane protein [Alphaproteobacteria bacterium]
MKVFKYLAFILCGTAHIAMADTLPEVMAYTYENSLTLSANRAGLKAIDEKVAQAKSGYRPVVLGEADVARARYKNTYDNAAIANKQKIYLTPTDVSLSFVQPVFSGLSTVNAVQSAKDTVRAGRSDLLNTEQAVLLDTAAVYMDVIRDEAVLKLQKNQEKVLREHLDSYRKKLKAGVLTRTDVKQAEARLAGATAARIAAEGQLQVSKANFFSIVGIEPKDLKDVKETFFTPPETLDKAIESALAGNPKIKAAEYAMRAAGSAVKSKKGALAPQVNLNGAVGRQKEHVSIKQSDYWQVGANLTVPLFQSGKEYADIREARQLENKYRILWSKTSQDVRAETIAAWERYNATKAQMDSIRQQINASQIALDGVIREANVGSRTVLDVLDAEQEHLDNQVSLVKAHREEIVSSYALMAAVGELNPKGLGLTVEPYDPKDYYESVKNKWIGYDIE